jgi:hypothetical protein
MSRELRILAPAAVAALGLIGIVLTHGPVSVALNVVCVLLALAAVLRYVAGLGGDDPWRELRREKKRRGRR